MNRPQASFGKKENARLASISLGGRRRLSCDVTSVHDATAYLKLREPIELPFRFDVVLDGTGEVFSVETRYQRCTEVVVNIESRYTPGIERRSAPGPGVNSTGTGYDEFDQWAGARRTPFLRR